TVRGCPPLDAPTQRLSEHHLIAKLVLLTASDDPADPGVQAVLAYAQAERQRGTFLGAVSGAAIFATALDWAAIRGVKLADRFQPFVPTPRELALAMVAEGYCTAQLLQGAPEVKGAGLQRLRDQLLPHLAALVQHGDDWQVIAREAHWASDEELAAD